MLNFLKLEEKINWNSEFLILGKGPSFSKEALHKINQSSKHGIHYDYNIFGLNHVAEVFSVHFTNIVDLDVLNKKIIRNSDNIMMPWHPHIANRPSSLNLQQLTIGNKYLDKLKRDHVMGKTMTYWYNLSTWKGKHKKWRAYNPTVKAKYFSVEVVIDILGMLGVKKIYTLGIDGGTEYADEFKHLKPLTNGRKVFDMQFEAIKTLKNQYRMEIIKL